MILNLYYYCNTEGREGKERTYGQIIEAVIVKLARLMREFFSVY